jgi:alpha-amylase
VSQKSIVLYMHVHQPFRVRYYNIFEIGHDHNYFDAEYSSRTSNEQIIHKVAAKSYLPTNQRLLHMLRTHPEFRLSLSITGTLLEQLQRWSPEALASFQELVATGRVEIVGETYHHSLAFFHDREEFEAQVHKHRQIVQELFGQTPTAFRNTELSYNNDLAYWADKAGYKAILAEGWDPILGWRSPNFVYQPTYTDGNIKLLLKNYKLSDDIAFRFGDRNWVGWPLTAAKFVQWLEDSGDATNFDLFMDYETFGEHQWSDSGIFDFLEHLPGEWLSRHGNTFKTVTQMATEHEAVDRVDVPYITTWADTERDLSAWTGNAMQQEALNALYGLKDKVLHSHDSKLIEDWRRLQTSDHFYYMCTKWFNDGDIHAYFSPYENPYEAYIAFMNAWHDLRLRTGVV